MQKNRVQQQLSRTGRALLVSILLLLAGCSSNGFEGTTPIALADLPTGIGRGFPVATLAQIDNSATGLEAGEQAPNFHMVLEDGRYLALADLQGRPILINFWATWCGPCRLEMPEIVAAANHDPDLVVLAVNVQEEVPQLTPFAEDFAMTMPIVRDEAGDLRDLYAVRGMPTSIFIDRQGNISTVWTGILTGRALDEFLATIQ